MNQNKAPARRESSGLLQPSQYSTRRPARRPKAGPSTAHKPRKSGKRLAVFSDEESERFSLVILQQIAHSRTIGMTLETLLPGCMMAGFKVTCAEIEDYLTHDLLPCGNVTREKGGVKSARYVATARGRGVLKQHGLAATATTARPKPRDTDAQRIIRNDRLREHLRLAILRQLDPAGRAGLPPATLMRGLIERGIYTGTDEMRNALDYLIEKGCVFRSGGGRYRKAVSLREIRVTALAYELASECAGRTGAFDWPRCKRNARARLARAARKG